MSIMGRVAETFIIAPMKPVGEERRIRSPSIIREEIPYSTPKIRNASRTGNAARSTVIPKPVGIPIRLFVSWKTNANAESMAVAISL